MPTIQAREEARREWANARRKARRTRFVQSLAGLPEELLDFNQVSQKLHLMHAVYRGVQIVPLDKIIGSVGRYKDFTRAFLPVEDDMSDRWQRVAAIYLDPSSSGVPPIELYKVGDSYFVKDGNHRVSVAHQIGMVDIEAYVWEYPAPVDGLGPNTDIDTLIIEAERRDFCAATRFDETRPNHGIAITAPGSYTALLAEIAQYQHAMSQIDEHAVTFQEAALLWYDLIYETSVQVIAQAGVLDVFPDRTPTDFYVWVRQYHTFLEDRYDRPVKLADAAVGFRRRQNPPLYERVWHAAARVISNFV